MTLISSYTLSSYVMQGLLVLLVICIIVKIGTEMRNPDNDIEWWQLIATKGADGKSYASPTKLWLNIGAVLVSWIVLYVVMQVDWEEKAFEVCTLVGSYLIFIAGVEAYAKHLQAKQGGSNVGTDSSKT